jgi:hypothetical protein
MKLVVMVRAASLRMIRDPPFSRIVVFSTRDYFPQEMMMELAPLALLHLLQFGVKYGAESSIWASFASLEALVRASPQQLSA